MWPARKNAHSRPSEIDWKYGDPIAESPSRKTGAAASGWSLPDSRQRRLVAFLARYTSSGIRMISRSPTSSPCVSALTLSMNRSIDCATLGNWSRSHAPSNDGGIASYSAWLMATMPVTWLMDPS